MKLTKLLMLFLTLSCVNIVFSLSKKTNPQETTFKYIKVDLPKIEPIELEPFTTFKEAVIDESSAIVKSRQYDDVYWTLNDSGDKSRIFPFNKNGEGYKPEWMENYSGLEIPNGVNIDWEDMAVDNFGNIIIGACGNNFNMRKDLALYFIREPHPQTQSQARVFKTVFFSYPEQDSFPMLTKFNFDCEAIFTTDNYVYLLTKHRSDKNTCLYRFDSLDIDKINPVHKLYEFEIDGMVTGADCSSDGKKLAVLTYTNVWLFESNEEGKWFEGKKLWMPIKAKQCEGICFDGNEIIITNEQKEIIKIPQEKFIEIK